MEKFYIIYKTSNLITCKSYIGKHTTSNLEDGYLGSGKILGRSIKKHGIENFKKEILCYCNSRKELNEKERELIKEHNTLSPNGYNLLKGGDGGFEYINDNKLNPTVQIKSAKSKVMFLLKTDQNFRNKFSKIMSTATKKAIQNSKLKGTYTNNFTGKHHSDSTKKVLSEKMSITSKGSRNSQFGTVWINNPELKTNKRIKSSDIIPLGWVKGRKMSFTKGSTQ
jgi:hypothetical protein